MIVVVEGISASGKTTWCAQHGGQHVIPENGRFENEPDRIKDPAGAAAFWAERNVDRWQTALAMEAAYSWAVCDSDPPQAPLHLDSLADRRGERTRLANRAGGHKRNDRPRTYRLC